MNYSLTLRNYLEEHKGSIFDVAHMSEFNFKFIEKKTMSRLMNRFDEEGLVTPITKGVFFINDGEDCTDEKIINYYVGEYQGMFLGRSLLYSLGLTKDKPEVYEILSSSTGMNRTFGNFRIERFKFGLGMLDEELHQALELIQFVEIDGDDFPTNNLIMRIHSLLERHYSNIAIKSVLRSRNYPLKAISRLSAFLDLMGIKNNLKDIYREITMSAKK